MQKLKFLLLEHRLILGLAAVLAMLMILPLLLFPLISDTSYRGINIASHGLDELWYLSRGKEVTEGHGLGNPLFREGKEAQDPYFTYAEYPLLSPLKWLGLTDVVTVPSFYAVFNAVGVFFLVLFIYFFVLQLSSDKLLSAAAAVMVIGGYIVALPNQLFSINVYSRAFSPYLPLLITFIYVNFLIKALRQTSWKYVFLSALAFGALFYTYFYAWSYILAVNGILFCIYLLRHEWSTAKRVFISAALGVGIGSLNIYHLWAASSSAMGKQLSYFHWVEHTRIPSASLFSFAVALLLIFFALKKRNDQNLPIFLSFILAGWLVMNQQIITGRMLQSGHYYSHFVIPFSLLVGGYILWPFLKKDSYKKIVATLLILPALLNTAAGQYRAALTQLQDKIYRQNYRPLIDALNKEKTPGVILAADHQDQYLFTIYTSHDLFWARGYLIVNVPFEERVKDALFVYMYFNKAARSDFKKYLNSALEKPDKLAIYGNNPVWFYGGIFETLEGYQSGLAYFDYENRVSSGLGDREIKEKRVWFIDTLTKEYAAWAKTPQSVLQTFKKYGINYIVWDKNKNPEWDLSFLPNKEEIASSNNIILYRLK